MQLSVSWINIANILSIFVGAPVAPVVQWTPPYRTGTEEVSSNPGELGFFLSQFLRVKSDSISENTQLDESRRGKGAVGRFPQ